MAKVSVSRRAASGIALIVAGALVLLVAILPLLNVAVPWLAVLAYLAIALALGIMGFGGVNSTLAKVTLIAAAVGWLVLALVAIPIALPSVLVTIAAVVAGLGGLIAGIVLYVGKEITNMAALAFIIAMALGLLFLLGGAIGLFSLANLAIVVIVLFGVALVVTGVLFRRKDSR